MIGTIGRADKMGKTRTYTYRLELRVISGAYYTPQGWLVRGSRLLGPGKGKPTAGNIDKWVTAFENSMRPGGVNAHLGIDQVTYARIVHQASGQVMAEWRRKDWRKNQPLFEVI
jgi:hypothetical protein